MKVPTQPELTKRLIFLKQRGLWILRQRVVFIKTVSVKRHELLYLKKTFDENQKNGGNIRNEETLYRGERLHCC